MKKRVSILALEDSIATYIMGPMDIFSLAGILWNMIRDESLSPYFQVEIVSLCGKAVNCQNGAIIQPHRSMEDVKKTDLIIISSASGNIEWSMDYHKKAIPWLRKHFENGTHIASICTGAFLLAETGLLNNKTATTHWGFIDFFKERYPFVNVIPEKLITDEGNLFCSAGANSGLDLSMYLIERYCGHKIMLETSKSLVLNVNRYYQAPFALFSGNKSHKDKDILTSQEWMEEHYSGKIQIESVSAMVNMSLRTFNRRFKKATGETPSNYVQLLRIEAAKNLLETEQESVESIAYRVGYEDTSFFRKVFKRFVCVTPNAYRKSFQKIHSIDY